MNIAEAIDAMPIGMHDPHGWSAEDEAVLSGGELAALRIARVLEDEFDRMDARHQSAFATALSQVASATSRGEAAAHRAMTDK